MRPTLQDALSADDAAIDTTLLEGFVGYAVRRTSLVITDNFMRHMAALELRPVGFSLLALVGSNPGITSSQLCTTLGIHSSNLVGLVKRLHDRDLIKRQPHPNDGRAWGLHLSAQGRALLDKALQGAAQADREATAHLSKAEVAQLVGLLRKVYASQK